MTYREIEKLGVGAYPTRDEYGPISVRQAEILVYQEARKEEEQERRAKALAEWEERERQKLPKYHRAGISYHRAMLKVQKYG